MKTDKCIKTGYNCGVKKTGQGGLAGTERCPCAVQSHDKGHGNRLHGYVGTDDADKNKKAAVAEQCLPTAA